jgi:hypothetical protein
MTNRSVLRELLASGLLVTLLLALTYVIGVAYYAGYLRGWGLPFEFMPLSRDGVLMQGAYAVMRMGASIAGPLVVVSFLVVLTLVVFISTKEWAVRSLTVTRLIARLASVRRHPIRHDLSVQSPGEPNTAVSVSSKRLFSFSVDAARIMLAGFIVFFALLWTMVGATRAGEAQARQDADCSSCATSDLTFGDDTALSGRVIRCNETHCIVQSNGKGLVFRLDDIKRIQTSPLARR